MSQSAQLEANVPDIVIRPLSPVMCAEIIGLDASRPLGDAEKRKIIDAFNEYKLLCFRDQDLTPDTLVTFTENWGTPLEHTMTGQIKEGVRPDVNVASNAGPDGKPNGKHPDASAMRWHTDRSWRPVPALATLLYGWEVPSVGADTVFANTTMAYEQLPEDKRRRFDAMNAIHSVEYSRRTAIGGPPATEHELRIAPPVPHPLARKHPATGRRALFLGCHAWKIEGLPEAEGRALLDELQAYATEDRFVYRHKWRKHDLLMWDNRCTLHAATPYDTAKELRINYRTVVQDTDDAPLKHCGGNGSEPSPACRSMGSRALRKTLVVTGASRGIGAAIARLAAERGYAVLVNYNRDRAGAEAVADGIVATGGSAAAFAADTGNEAAVRAMFDAAEARLGPIDALVNNAAITGGTGKFVDMEVEAIAALLQTNVLGVMLCAREAIRRMATDRGGRGGTIVNVSSVGALLGSPGERVHYAASKGAVNSFTTGLAKEVIASGIRVNAVSPGVTDTGVHNAERLRRVTPNIPIRRPALPEEIARTVLFLLSDDSSYIVGANIIVSGGR